MSNLNPKQIKTSTQKYLDIAEIREDVVVMKDGTVRGVVLVASVNFALKSAEEQEATVASYANFLNSLSFPLQIVIQSRKLNIDKYLASIKELGDKQTNELLKIQTSEYVEYVKELVELGEIMSKQFYVVIPYSTTVDKRKTFIKKFSEALTPTIVIRLKRKKFLEYKTELDKRVEQVETALTSMGLASARLNTQSLIELYYKTYNPLEAESEKMANVGELRVE